MTAVRPQPTAQTALGRELRRIRTELLQLTGPKMAAWLGVDTFDSRGRPTSTGKSLVSRFESGARIPDETVIDQYANAPEVDAAALRELWAQAAAVCDPPPSAPDVPHHHEADETDAPQPTGAGGRRVSAGAVAAVVALVAGVAVGGSLLWVRSASEPEPDMMTTPVPGITLQFDALGVTSDQTIRIFHGPGESESDRAIDGTYENGESAAIVCMTSGRRVTSDPDAGEAPKTSDQWARIVASDGRISYATMTYARIRPLTAPVPPCEVRPIG